MKLEVPKNTFTFLFLPPFCLSFLLSSPPSSFLSLLSFFPPSFLPFFFSVNEKCVIFSWPLIQICTSGRRGVIYYMKLEVPKNTFTFLFLPPFCLSFLLSSPPSSFLFLLSFSPPSFLPFFFSSFLSMKNVSFFSWPLI